MSAQYDAIAREYQATKQSPLRVHAEAYSFFSMLEMLGDCRCWILPAAKVFIRVASHGPALPALQVSIFRQK